MERTEEFKAGDRNSGNGNSLEQLEAKAAVFEDGQIRDTTGEIRPMKDGEAFVYGDSRPDDPSDRGGFVPIDDSPMMNTTRESLPEAHGADPALLEANRHGGNEEIRPRYNKVTDEEGQILVNKEKA